MSKKECENINIISGVRPSLTLWHKKIKKANDKDNKRWNNVNGLEFGGGSFGEWVNYFCVSFVCRDCVTVDWVRLELLKREKKN